MYKNENHRLKVQASPNANTFAITGTSQVKQLSEMLPQIVSQMGPEGFAALKKAALGAELGPKADEEIEVPELEGSYLQSLIANQD